MHDAKAHSDDEYLFSEEEISGKKHDIEIRRILERTGRSQIWTYVFRGISDRAARTRRLTSPRQQLPIRRASKKGPKETQMWLMPKQISLCFWEPAVFNSLPEELRAQQVDQPKVVFPHPPPGVALTQQWVLENIVDSRAWFQEENMKLMEADEARIGQRYHVPSAEDAARLLAEGPYVPSDAEDVEMDEEDL